VTQKPTRRRAGKTPATPKRRRGRPTREESRQREAACAQFAGERVVHRYGNRRFYDLQARRAVTLDEIGELVRQGEQVRVLDVENDNQDITRRVLTHVLLEAKSRGSLEMLPVEFLRKLISTKDEKTAVWLDGYLKAGAALLDRSVREGMQLSSSYHKQLTELMQGVVPRSWGVPPKRDQRDAAPSEIEELRRRLDELVKSAATKSR
jgi:polyhydroxyalkanoate synthesis repressor PhaR